MVRARLEQGALDSMINLLLFGTSFTTQPRVITMRDFEDPVVQARVADLVEALRDAEITSGSFFCETFSKAGGSIRNDSPDVREQKLSSWKIFAALCRSRTLFANGLTKQAARATKRQGLSKRSLVFRDRGISVDTTILSSFGIEARCAT